MALNNTGNSVPSDKGLDLQDNAKTIDELVNDSLSLTTTRTGKSVLTRRGLELQYIQTAINGGVWASGQTFTAFNQYMVFSGTAYKPISSTPLPHVIGATPDLAKVEPVDTGALIVDGHIDRLNPATLAIWQDDASAQSGDVVTTAERSTGNGGGGTGDIIAGVGTANGANIVAHNTLSLSFDLRVTSPISAIACGVANAIDSKVFIQAAQDFSELHKQPLDFRGLTNVRFTGGITFASWFEWHGPGNEVLTFTPTTKDNTVVGSTHWISQAVNTVDVERFLQQDFAVDGEFAGGFPTGNQFLGWSLIEANGSNDKDITHIRVKLIDIPFDGLLHRVVKASGGTIDKITQLFCQGNTNHIATPNRNANLFKTIHGAIGNVGPIGEYPITNVVSFGGSCRGWRTFADFKRGTRHFSHNNTTVIDMSDVCSFSCDGAKDGTVGPNNTGFQTAAFADAKNFYEVQGEDIEILGGDWDANNRADVVAGLLVTDFVDPGELDPGVYDSNPSINVNCRGMTVRGISPAQSAIRYLQTSNCHVQDIIAENIGFAAVSFEFAAGKFDKDSNPVTSSGNSVDYVRESNCTLSVSAAQGNIVSIGENIFNEDGQMDIDINNIAGTGVDVELVATYNAKELNTNQYFKSYGGATTQIIDWESGAATRLFQITDKPLGVGNALTLDDTSSGVIESTVSQFDVAVKQNDIIYFTIDVKAGTGASSSINIQEFNVAAFVSNTFVDLVAAAGWETRVRKYKVTGAATTRLIFNINPAANDNGDSAQTGTTHFANLRISRKLNNLK